MMKSKEAAEPNDALATVHLRNEFYRDNFRRMVWVLLASISLNILLAVGLAYTGSKTPTSYFFSTTQTGQLIPLYPTTQPVVTNSTVLSWVSNNVPQIYQLDFINYRSQLNQLQGYFTATGWRQFVGAFGGQLKDLVSQQIIMSATPENVPVITGSGVFNGVYKWQVQMPLVLNLQQGNTQTTQHVLLTIVIDRVNNVSANQLLGISQIIQQVQQQ
jgi:intracellular multiplication protein IcmL